MGEKTQVVAALVVLVLVVAKTMPKGIVCGSGGEAASGRHSGMHDNEDTRGHTFPPLPHTNLFDINAELLNAASWVGA